MILRKITLMLLLVAVSSVAMSAEHEVKVECRWGDIGATLSEPDGGSDTAVLIVAGSGPTDRNGNSANVITSYCYKLLADGLCDEGLAVMRYDKRGVGQSYLPQEMVADVVFGDFVDDAVSCVGYLREAGYRRVVVVGHSEGAHIALEMAQREDAEVDGLVLLCGPGYTIDVLLQRQLAAQLMPAHIGLMLRANDIIAQLKRGETAAAESVPMELTSLFHPMVQPFLISNMQSDPQRLAASCSCPFLVVSGGRDIQVSVDNGEQLAKGENCVEHIIFEKMAHVLKDSDTLDRMEQLTTVYNNGWQPLSEGLVASIATFIDAL